ERKRARCRCEQGLRPGRSPCSIAPPLLEAPGPEQRDEPRGESHAAAGEVSVEAREEPLRAGLEGSLEDAPDDRKVIEVRRLTACGPELAQRSQIGGRRQCSDGHARVRAQATKRRGLVAGGFLGANVQGTEI